MTPTLRHLPFALILSVLIGGCASGPKITSLPAEAEPVDAPYTNVLVVSLFKSVKTRKRFENEVVSQLSARGVEATAMTSVQSSGDTLDRDAVLRQVQRLGADAVLVTQLLSLDSNLKEKKQSPFGGYKFRTTPYHNVYGVETVIYDKLPLTEMVYDAAVRTDLYAASSKKTVWSMGSERHVEYDAEQPVNYINVIDEAQVVVRRLAKKKLIN